MNKLLTISALACATAFSANAEVRINGFANLVGGVTSSDDSLYGYDDQISFSSESLFAIQVSGDVNDKTTATAQLVARGNNDYEADFEWAYLTYQASDNVSVSAGRLRLPLFKYSASKDVGYSYHWVNAPRAVYDVNFNNLDGIRVDYSNYAGDWEYNFQGAIGTLGTDLNTSVGPARLSGKNVMLVSAEAANGFFKARAVYVTAKVTLANATIDGTVDQLRQAGLSSLAEDLAFDDDTGTFLGFGLEYDTFDWFVGGEWTEIDIEDTFNPKNTAFYVTAGFRSGKWTPSVTYEALDGNHGYKFLDKVAALPEAVQPTATAVTVGLQMPFVEEFSVVSVGVRYDVDTNLALKADVSKYSDDVDSASDANLLRFAVNYVF